MSKYGYPPSHRNHRSPQPEVCELCGLLVEGRQLQTLDIEGLRGRRVCEVHSEWRNKPTRRDVERFVAKSIPGGQFVGQSRIFDPGDPHWWQMDPNRSATEGDPLTDDTGRELVDDQGRILLEDFG